MSKHAGRETGQDSTVLASPPPCLLSVENLSQRICLIREVKDVKTKGNSQRRLKNNNAVLKRSQGL